eukprot:8167415-Pyramimonas_sp.AAC.1
MGGYRARCRAVAGIVAPCQVCEALYLAGLPAYAAGAALSARCRAVGDSVALAYRGRKWRRGVANQRGWAVLIRGGSLEN